MPGRRLGHYEVLAPLGRGGMGEVFRAIDTHLEREVALKVLNDDLAGDDKLLARFDREAKLLAAVHHPNIAAIHSIEYADGKPFLVLELVRGRSLKSRLESGPLPPSEAFEIARQIAAALAAAHARRVIHRDLKPANVMVTPEGVVKLLDFGVAKALEIDRSGAREGSAAVGSEAITTSGLILGTAPYMSPEQVRGKPLDARSDIWSFGCVLYEMLAGRPAFQRTTMGDTLAAIIDCEVDWNALPATTPPPIRRLLQRCLQADPQRRLPDVAAVPRDLEAALQATGGATGALARALDHRAYRWGLAAMLVVVLAATFLLGGGWLGGSRAPAPAVDETTAMAVPLTALLGSEEAPSLSPDARFVAFAWDGGAGSVFDLYVQQIGSGDPLRLTDGSADITAPTWSPDASELAFLRNGAGGWRIAAVPPLGGPERSVGTVSAVTFPGLDYAPTGERLAVVHRPSAAAAEAIFLVERDTGEMTRLSEPERAGDGDRSPAFSPDGQSLAFVRWHELPRNDIYVTDLAGNGRLLISHDAFIEGLAWLPDGSGLLFSSARAGTTSSLWRVDLRGRAQPLDFGDSARAVSTSRNSLVYTRRQQDTNLWIVSGPAAPEPAPPRRLIASTRDDWAPDFSPDGRRIAFASDRSGDARVWICASDGSGCEMLPTDGLASAPRWSPDGSRIVYGSESEGRPDVRVIPVDGGTPRVVASGESINLATGWSADSRSVYIMSDRSGSYQIWRLDVDSGETVQLTQGGGALPKGSGDGRWVYYLREEEPLSIWRVGAAGGEEEQVFEHPGLTLSGFAVWGEQLVYFLQEPGAPISAQLLDPGTGATREILQLPAGVRLGRYGRMTVSQDGLWIVYPQQDGAGSDLMLVNDLAGALAR